MTGDRRLWMLAVGNLILGGVVTLLAPIQLSDPFGLAQILPPSGLRDILLVPLFASVLCQAVLLSLWVVTSTLSPWQRTGGLFAGTVCLEVLLSLGSLRELQGCAAVTIVGTTAILLVVRALGVRLARQDDPRQPAQPETEGLKFTIRSLMLFTAAVALLSAGVRVLQESPKRFLLLTTVWAMCFVAVGLVSLWAALGKARPLWRGTVVLVFSPVLGAFFASAAEAHRAGWVYIILTMLLYSALLLGSLLVVRSCGYRLVRRAVSSSEPFPGGGGRSPFQTPASGGTTSG
jgi:hypothetical protein